MIYLNSHSNISSHHMQNREKLSCWIIIEKSFSKTNSFLNGFLKPLVEMRDDDLFLSFQDFWEVFFVNFCCFFWQVLFVILLIKNMVWTITLLIKAHEMIRNVVFRFCFALLKFSFSWFFFSELDPLSLIRWNLFMNN